MTAGGCTLADADAAFGAAVEEGSGRLSNHPTAWKRYALTEPTPRKVRVFHGPSGVILVETAQPAVAGSVDALLTGLGAAEETLPARESILDHETADWVYAARGLTLTVGIPFATRDQGRVLVHLFLFARTTARDYVDRLGGKDPWVIRRPKR